MRKFTRIASVAGIVVGVFLGSAGLALAAAYAVGVGGTGQTRFQANTILLGNGTSPLATTTQGTNGQVLALVNGVPTWQATTTLSTISGVLSVSKGGTGVQTITGLIKGNGTSAFSAATAGTDYQAPISLTTSGTSGAATFVGNTLNIPQYANTTYTAGTGLTLTGTSFSVNTSQNISTLSNLTSNGLVKTSGGTGALSIAVSGTDYAPATSGSAILKGNGSGGFSSAANGTDYTLITANTCSLGQHVLAITAAGVITCSADTGTGGSSGLGTTSPWTGSGVAYRVSDGAVSTVATSSVGFSAAFSGASSLGALVGGSNSTIDLATNGVALTKLAQIAGNTILGNNTGATGNVVAFATSTLGIALADTTGTLGVSRGGTGQVSFTSSQLLYGNGTNGLSSVATSTLTATSPLTGSFTQIGAGGALGCQTASGSQAGCLSSTDWTTFNNKLSSAITAIGPAGQTQTGATITIATTTAAFNGLTSNLTVTGAGNTLTFAPTLTGLLGLGGGGTGTSTAGFTGGVEYNDGTKLTNSGLFYYNGAGRVEIGTTTSANSALNLIDTNSVACNGLDTITIGGNPAGDTDYWICRNSNNDGIANDALQFGTGLVPGANGVVAFGFNGTNNYYSFGTTSQVSNSGIAYTSNATSGNTANATSNAASLVQENTNATDGTLAANDFRELNTAGTSILTGRFGIVNMVHSAGSETGDYIVALNGTGTIAEKFRIKGNGNTGIGTTTPNWLLQEAGTRPFLTLSDTSAGANLKHWGISSQGGNLYVNPITDVYATSTNPSLALLRGGNVGIGTALPTKATLEVMGTTTTSSGHALTVWNSTPASLFDIDDGGVITLGTTTAGTLKTTSTGVVYADTSGGASTITLSGDVSGSGTTAITTTIGALKVLGSMIANATIDLTTKVTGLLPVANGGTASSTLGGILAGNGTSAVKSALIGTGLSWNGTTLSASAGVKVLAYKRASTQAITTSQAKIVFDIEDYDTGSNFASSIFTAPTTAYYQVNFSGLVAAGISSLRTATAYLVVNGTVRSTSEVWLSTATTEGATIVLNDLVPLTAGDTVEIDIIGSATGNNLGTDNGSGAFRTTWVSINQQL